MRWWLLLSAGCGGAKDSGGNGGPTDSGCDLATFYVDDDGDGYGIERHRRGVRDRTGRGRDLG